MGFLLNILAFYIFYLVGFLRGKRRGLDLGYNRASSIFKGRF